ncbi:MAG TPA: hypothetical protein VHB97_19630 [Polyangia bacterium]|nr:hypothetical protein [Polyangia bacterium]
MPSEGLPYRVARRELLDEFERIYLLSLLEKHGIDLRAAAREADLPLDELTTLVRKHTRPYFIARVQKFYGDKLRSDHAQRIADELLTRQLTL